MSGHLIFACLCVCVYLLKENASGGSAAGSTCGSRPASQMSHTASSGYGSARSHNRATSVSAEAPSTSGGRQAALFRSLRMPHRAEASYGVAGVASGTETLPLRSVAEIPVPAPRFHTLNNKKKPAYQNIPLPLKTHPVSVQDAQFFQVGFSSFFSLFYCY